ncbi:MAG: biliverdin-producing heme oxygenase [Pseudomonadota bacterium]
MSARAALRLATAPDHARVDAAFSQYDLSSREGYRRFLLRQAAAHLPVERALDGGVAIEDWPERRRADAIRADLADLGCTDIAEAPFGGFSTPAEMLGGAYVLEGSRLGGQLLRKQVSDGLPTRFLAKGSSEAWRALLTVLETKLTSPEEIAAAVKGARAVFACFEAAAGREVEIS